MTEPNHGGRRPVRVLQVLAQDELAGTELMLASLLERFDRTRIESELVTLSRPGPIGARLGRLGIRVQSLGPRTSAALTLALGRVLRRGRYAIVNAYGFRASLLARIAARLAAPQTKVIVGVRGLHITEAEELDSGKAQLALLLERLTSGWVDHYDANSRGAVELIASAGVERSRITYIPNGIDLAASPHRNGQGRADGSPLVVCVARFSPLKRHQDLLRALSIIKHEGVAFRAVLAGEGPALGPCRELTRRLGLERHVELPGSIEPRDVRALLEHARVACLTSVWEGMPGFVMEAMAHSVPVVATNVNGTDELVRDGEDGFLVRPKDPAAAAVALRRVLEDGRLAQRLGASARRRIEEGFSLDAMVAAKQLLYEKVAA